jgi:hypothetical protein
MTAVKFLERPPAGWFVLAVMPWEEGGRDWVALVTDVNPDTDYFYVRRRCNDNTFVRIPGKHRSRTAAWNAFEDQIATRH